ncbi:hypothetical protein P74p51 [Thermus phage P74-26]|uniref:Uncharacterized protein n=1 Tax=Thermus phage P74-26 TaxID=2914007 RepID=A7XXM2_BP742|nr:hypothetical protein P74p51 [Thermus phage P74-26]ABU97001.1 conserved hypothetical protein [Thermus phage P74-26]
MPHLTDSTPWLTASLTRTRVERRYGTPYHVIAVSRDLAKRIPFGTEVRLVCGDRVIYGLVEDLMHKRWRSRADIWFPSLHQAKAFGVCRGYLEVLKPVRVIKFKREKYGPEARLQR